jgi:ribonuclease-3
MSTNQIDKLQQTIGYQFRDIALLSAALTHSSFTNESKQSRNSSNERLEFLGDSVLGMTVAQLIYSANAEMPEGQMSKMRAELVCEKNLAALAKKIELGSCLILGKGEDKNGGRERPSILADAFEAVIAAMYLDGGMQPVFNFISSYLDFSEGFPTVQNSDHKTALQEIIQEKSGQKLSYTIIGESGPDHMKLFNVEVRLNGKPLGTGEGRTKKEAEQNAAKSALEGVK